MLDLLTESFQLDDVVMQRLSECWDQANQLRKDATPTSDAAVQAVQVCLSANHSVNVMHCAKSCA